jgi:hypothetical protein
VGSIEHVLSPFEDLNNEPARANREGAKDGKINDHAGPENSNAVISNVMPVSSRKSTR